MAKRRFSREFKVSAVKLVKEQGYSIPEAAESCTQASTGPRATDLLIQFLSDSLGGKIALPQGGRIVQAAASPGGAGTAP